MIRSLVNCVVNLVLVIQCLYLNIMWSWVLQDGVKQLSVWGPCWIFMCV